MADSYTPTATTTDPWPYWSTQPYTIVNAVAVNNVYPVWCGYDPGTNVGTVQGYTAVSNNTVWIYWNGICPATGTTINTPVTPYVDPWVYWNGVGITGNAVYVQPEEQVWSKWNEGYVPKSEMERNPQLAQDPTAERRAELDQIAAAAAEAQRIREQEARDAQAKREAAKKRAKRLLKSMLNKKQNDEFDKSGTFQLEVGDNLYLITPGTTVKRFNKKTQRWDRQFCIHTAYDHPLPPEDVALAQKLLLEADEPTFLKIANESAA